MIDVEFNGNFLQMHNDINMPVEVYTNYNRYVLIDSGIGATITDLDTHIAKAVRFIDKDQKKEATDTLMNLRQCYSFIVENTSPELLSFCALVYSINGKVWEDKSDDGLKKLSELLAKKGITTGKIKGFLLQVKKNLIARYKRSFP